MLSGYQGKWARPDSRPAIITSPRLRVCLVGPRLINQAFQAILTSFEDVEIAAMCSSEVVDFSELSEAGIDVVLFVAWPGVSLLTELMRQCRAGIPLPRIVVISESRLSLPGQHTFMKLEWQSSHEPIESLLHSLRGQRSPYQVGDDPDPVTESLGDSSAATLAPREIEVLHVLATGVSIDDAAALLGVSVYTVRSHLRNINAKLNTHGKLDAIMRAIRLGLIQIS